MEKKEIRAESADKKLYFEPKAFLNDLVSDIDKSKSQIDIEMYIWAPDSFAQQIEQRLISAAHRGVRVHVLVDGIGSYEWIQNGKKMLEKHGVAVKVFNPVPQVSSFLGLPKKILKLFGLVNKRNHRKIIMIDEKICYLGSFNVMKEAAVWRENGVRVTGKVLTIIKKLHADAWKSSRNFFKKNRRIDARGLLKEVVGSKTIFTTHHTSMRQTYRDFFLKMIFNATERVWLMTPYFNPPRALLNSLMKAGKKNVDVRLILPMRSDVPYVQWMANRHYKELIYSGVKIYEYQPRILHAKGALIDNTAMVGSGNLNYRSFFKDIELNLVMTEKADIEALEKQFDMDFKNSKRIIIPDRIAFWKKVIAFFLSFFKESF